MIATELSRRIDAIERGYEYLLAYAAQGRQNESGSEVRDTLQGMHDALAGLGALVRQRLVTDSPRYDVAPFFEAVERDANTARSAIALVLSRATISSLLVDNLNASVHVRALLTDVFLVEQALRG